MKPQLHEQFVNLKNVGKKEEARRALNAFIASFDSFEEKRVWTKIFLKTEGYDHKIRYELYEQIVFPVLLDGYEKRDVWSTLWLARTLQNCCSSKKLYEQIEFKSPHRLFREAYDLEPNEETRKELLNADINWFSYSQHEWPWGILWGKDGATLDECQNILSVIIFTRSLDTEQIYTSHIDDYENKVQQYIVRL